MRNLPKNLPQLPDDAAMNTSAERITQVREYAITTALFGGGVEPSQADPITVVRATAVRGHLRFWWRATRGGRYSSLRDMQAAEDAIWGTAATPNGKVGQSAVWVEVVVLERGEPLTVRWYKQKELQPPSADVGNPSSPLSYVAFPLREEKDDMGRTKPQPVLSKVRFAVIFSYVEEVEVPTLSKRLAVAKELSAALWAWETFGGIGGRTRRGFGALRCEHIDGQPNTDLPDKTEKQVFRWLTRKLEEYEVTQRSLTQDNVPLLPTVLDANSCWVGHIANNGHHAAPVAEQAAMDTWVGLFNKMKAFRQQRPSTRPPGRNQWPEPDEIRRLADTHTTAHAPISKIRKFPRAAFGLPIQFEFKKDDIKVHPPDPRGKNLLQPKQDNKVLERFASPLILKPLACSDGVIGLALILDNTAVPTTLSIETSRGEKDVSSELTPAEANSILNVNGKTKKPLLGRETDVLKAFLRFLQK
ncbi:MAG: type III-B CRISPR module RAMP protein Cmr1 [Chloroflexaceae bacterium]|nr:type III-B CRISPR module RAMP protein Cmr1 [Chloroflexaceae bacterium]